MNVKLNILSRFPIITRPCRLHPHVANFNNPQFMRITLSLPPFPPPFLSLSLLQTCCNMQTILGNPLKLCKVINYEHYTIQLFKRINTAELRLDAAIKYVGAYILIYFIIAY